MNWIKYIIINFTCLQLTICLNSNLKKYGEVNYSIKNMAVGVVEDSLSIAPIDLSKYVEVINGNRISLVIKYNNYFYIGLQNGLFKVDNSLQNFELLFSCEFPQNLILFGDSLYFSTIHEQYVISLINYTVQQCENSFSQVSENFILDGRYIKSRQTEEETNLMERLGDLFKFGGNLYKDIVYYQKDDDYSCFYSYNPNSGEMNIFIHQEEGGVAMLPIFDGDDCYYISHSLNRELHKLDMKTKEDIIIATDVLYSFNAYDRTAYYAKWNEESRDSYICSNRNGVEKILMTNPYLFRFEHRDEANWSDYGSPVVLNIVDDRLFFIIYQGQDRRILTMKTDGTDIIIFDSVQ